MEQKVYNSLLMRREPRQGFTLIELLLYVAIASMILLAVTLFLPTLLDARVKNQTIAEVEQQGLQVMQRITQTLRNAEVLTAPTAGATGTTLSVDTITASNNPTVFDLSGGVLYITEGAGTPVPLTNNRVTVSGLTFRNLSRTNTPGVIHVEFTVTHNNPANKKIYDFSKTFVSSAALR